MIQFPYVTLVDFHSWSQERFSLVSSLIAACLKRSAAICIRFPYCLQSWELKWRWFEATLSDCVNSTLHITLAYISYCVHIRKLRFNIARASLFMCVVSLVFDASSSKSNITKKKCFQQCIKFKYSCCFPTVNRLKFKVHILWASQAHLLTPRSFVGISLLFSFLLFCHGRFVNLCMNSSMLF